MKILIRVLGFIVLTTPLFSALLTEDLEVVTPTGLPMEHASCEAAYFNSSSNYSITVRFVETPEGIFIVREHVKAGVVQLSHPYIKPKCNIIVLKSSSVEVVPGDVLKMNVNTE